MSPSETAPPIEDVELKSERGIYLLLRNRITQWHYPPGYHLGEKALCQEFNVSRVPIREALSALMADGFVIKKANQGCFVKQLNVDEAKELFEMRVALERHIVEQLAVSGLSADTVLIHREVWTHYLEPKTADFDVTQFVETDNNFHLSLAEAHGNRCITKSLEDINERLRFTKLAVEATSERLTETAVEHLAILDAILARDADAAKAAMTKNIEHSGSRVEVAISRALMAAHAMY